MARFKPGTVALITGAAGGIGSSVTRRLAAEGVAVALTDLNGEALKTLAEQLPREHPVHLGPGDLTDAGFRRELAAGTVERLGRLDVVVGCAGIISGGPPEQITEQEWDRVMDINVKAPFFLIQEALPHLILSGGGAVVSLSSIMGQRAGQGFATYSVSKAAVVALTGALAVDLADVGVRVNALCPGTIDTPMPWDFAKKLFGSDNTELAHDAFVARQLFKRLGTPDEVAAAAVFLASDEASFITGIALPVDGGWSAW